MTELNPSCDQSLFVNNPDNGTSPLCENLSFTKNYSQKGYEAARPSFTYILSVPLMIAICHLTNEPCYKYALKDNYQVRKK